MDLSTAALARFVEDVGSTGEVTAVGGRTAFEVGGPIRPGTREVRAPAGVVAFEPAEMTVRVGAGTLVAELDEVLAERGQTVAIPTRSGSTVGGVLSVGRSGVRRLGWGPVRDTVLEARYVSAEGRAVKAGGPTVKNVSGFDLCRLLVGSLGTLGLLGEVVLRTRPLPPVSRWFSGVDDPFVVRAVLHRPSALLWNGETVWALLEGDGGDVEDEEQTLRQRGWQEVEGPPPLPAHRWSVDPATLPTLPALVGGESPGTFVAQVGVGIVHADRPPPRRVPSASVEVVTRRLKQLFDPSGRLNPGRDVLAT